MNFQQFVQKAFEYNPTLSAPELSEQITEQAFNTSSLLQNIGMKMADNPSYRNVYVSQYPSVVTVTQGAVIPKTTVQTYTTTSADFTKIATSIELSNEVVNFNKFDIEANTASLVGTVMADEVANYVVSDIETRAIDTRPTDPSLPTFNEQILKVKSGVNGSWGADELSVYEFIADAIKEIPDAYDSNSKLFCNKNNFVFLTTLVQVSGSGGGDQVWLVQNGLVLGRYEIVIADQLDDNTMYFGDLESAFDVVTLFGNQTKDDIMKPDTFAVTNTQKFSNVCKDSLALVILKAEV